jgi:hypothetical protein
MALSSISSALKTISHRCPEHLDDDFKLLLQHRLEDARAQLKAPGLTQSMKWYLNAEIERIQQRIEGRAVDVEEEKEGGKDIVRVKEPEAYTEPFCKFLSENPTVFHAVEYFSKKLRAAGFKKVCLYSLCLSQLFVTCLQLNFLLASYFIRT